MSGPLPIRESTFQRLITVLLLVFVISLAVGLVQAHCAEVVKPALIYGSLSAADLASTSWAEHHGSSEGNAFMRSDRVLKAAALASALTVADAYLTSRKRRRSAKALRISVAVVRVAAVAINVRNARRAR